MLPPTALSRILVLWRFAWSNQLVGFVLINATLVVIVWRPSGACFGPQATKRWATNKNVFGVTCQVYLSGT